MWACVCVKICITHAPIFTNLFSKSGNMKYDTEMDTQLWSS